MASRNQAIEKYNAGKYKTALNIAKNFKMGVTDEQRSQMALGYECMAHEDTYVQMGYDCEAEINKALDILKVVLGIKDTVEEDLVPMPGVDKLEELHEEYAADDVQVTEEVVDAAATAAEGVADQAKAAAEEAVNSAKEQGKAAVDAAKEAGKAAINDAAKKGADAMNAAAQKGAEAIKQAADQGSKKLGL